MENYAIRNMHRPELDNAMEWAEREGWNPGLHDADHFYRADANGLYVGLLDDEPIGCIASIAYGDAYGFMGLFIVKPEFRKRGYGLPLFHTAFGRLKNMNIGTIGLEGAVAQQKNYEKAGFRMAYRTLRYQGAGIGDHRVSDAVVELQHVDFSEFKNYDAECFLAPRGDFLEFWIRQRQGAAFAFMDNGRISGYGVMRACNKGFRIGPLFADSPAIAGELLRALLGQAGKEIPVFIDVPEINAHGVQLMAGHGMGFVLENARMYYGEPLPLSAMDRIFGTTTLELG